MKSNAKCRIWGGFGQLGDTEGHWQPNHSRVYATSYSF